MKLFRGAYNIYVNKYTVSNVLLEIFFYVFFFILIILNTLDNVNLEIIKSLLKINFLILQTLVIYLVFKNKMNISKEIILFFTLAYFILFKTDKIYFYINLYVYIGCFYINLRKKNIKKILGFVLITFLLKLIIEKKNDIIKSYNIMSQKEFEVWLLTFIVIICVFFMVIKIKNLNIRTYIFMISGIILTELFKNNMYFLSVTYVCIESLIIILALIIINLFDFFIKNCCKYSVLNRT